MVFAKGGWKGGTGSYSLTDIKFQFHNIKRVLKIGYQATWIHLTVLKYTLKNGKDGKFYVICITIKKKESKATLTPLMLTDAGKIELCKCTGKKHKSQGRMSSVSQGLWSRCEEQMTSLPVFPPLPTLPLLDTAATSSHPLGRPGDILCGPTAE